MVLLLSERESLLKVKSIAFTFFPHYKWNIKKNLQTFCTVMLLSIHTTSDNILIILPIVALCFHAACTEHPREDFSPLAVLSISIDLQAHSGRGQQLGNKLIISSLCVYQFWPSITCNFYKCDLHGVDAWGVLAGCCMLELAKYR